MKGYIFTEKLGEIRNILTNILENLTGGVIVIDRAGRIQVINLAARKILGINPQDDIPAHVFDIVAETSDVGAQISRALYGNHFVQDLDLVYERDPRAKMPVRITTSPLRDGQKGVVGFIILIKDITELMRLEQQLRTTDKMRAMGTLAAGIAHEIKNPLSALDLNLHLLREEVLAPSSDPAEIGKYLDILEAEIRRLNGIVDNFLRFSRPARVEFKHTHVAYLLQYVIRLVEHEAGEKSIVIDAEIDPGLPPVLSSEALIEQAFLNIIINAFQAMPQGGRLHIKTSQTSLSWGEDRRPMIEVSFSDSGVGILPEDLGRIFDPYFTTSDEGVGLGLTIAHRIIEDHKGTVTVASVVGKGTTMIVRLPIADGTF